MVNVRLTSGLPLVSPVLSRGKIQVSTWNEKAARRLSARATHTKRESTLVFCAPYDVLATWPRVKQILDILICLVKSKTCLAFANPPTSPLKGEPPIDTS